MISSLYHCSQNDVLAWLVDNIFVCTGEVAPELPVILANWHHDYYWEANVTHVDELTTAMKAAPVSHLQANQAHVHEFSNHVSMHDAQLNTHKSHKGA